MDLPSLNLSALYGAVLIPFRNEAFGPTLATGLLAAALAILIVFLIVAIPQAFKLGSALRAIRRGSAKESEQQKRLIFQSKYKEIDAALSTNKVTSSAWKEFRKTLIVRDSQRPVILASNRPQNFFNARNLRAQY